MSRILSEDEWLKLTGEGVGYVYNDFSGDRPEDGWGANKLHKASCYTLRNPNITPTQYLLFDKYFGEDLVVVVAWLMRFRGVENKAWARCRQCRPVG